LAFTLLSAIPGKTLAKKLIARQGLNKVQHRHGGVKLRLVTYEVQHSAPMLVCAGTRLQRTLFADVPYAMAYSYKPSDIRRA
jgi:hypothetical protein